MQETKLNQLVYHVENINNPDVNNSRNTSEVLSDIPDDELSAVIQKIRVIYKKLSLSVDKSETFHPVLKEEMDSCSDELNKFKHMRQQASLLSLMEGQGFLREASCFVEFGAGKGQLMYWIVKCAPEPEKASFILVDRKPPKHRSDNKLKQGELHIERLKMDIQHLHLGNIQGIENKLENVVGVGKHLCGGATDLAINCLLNTLLCKKQDKEIKYVPMGVLLALCCHHRCTWSAYVGKEFLGGQGISEREFAILRGISSWAVCGLRKQDAEIKNEDEYHSVEEPKFVSRYKNLNLTHEDRESIGIHCKRIIDAGRLSFLRSRGLTAKLVAYTDKSTSLENVALLAFRSES